MDPKLRAEIIDLLTDCEEYFDNMADVVDGDYGAPEPNPEMVMASRCDHLLTWLGVSSIGKAAR